jgi:hypothetical protein
MPTDSCKYISLVVKSTERNQNMRPLRCMIYTRAGTIYRNIDKPIFSQADTCINTFSKISIRKKTIPANFILNITSRINLIYKQSERSVFCKLSPRLVFENGGRGACFVLKGIVL